MPLRNSLVSCLLGAVAAAFALGIPMWGQEASAPINVGGVQITGLPDDWSHHHLVFSNPGTAEEAMRNGTYDRWVRIQNDPRYLMQQIKRERAAQSGDSAADAVGVNANDADLASLDSGVGPGPAKKTKGRIKRDWNMTLGAGGKVGADMYPAKWSFSDTPACTDFVVFNTSLAGSGTQATIAAFSNIYKTTCGGTVPSTLWAYNTGAAATAVTSPVLSFEGTQVAFVQSTAGVASLVLLKWASCTGTCTVSAPVVPASVSNATYRTCPTLPCMTTFSLTNNDTLSPPFYDYGHDILYVGDDQGILHKYTGVFQGTPAAAPAPWPVLMTDPGATTRGRLTGPVYDTGSGLVFVGDTRNGSFTGRFHSVIAATGTGVTDNGSTLSFYQGILDAPFVDSSAAREYVFTADDNQSPLVNCSGFAYCAAVWQFPSSLATVTEAPVGVTWSTTDVQYDGMFDNAYFTSGAHTGKLYVCGRDNGTAGRPVLWQVSINSNVMSSTTTQGPTLTSAYASCSPVAEIFNTTGGNHDWIFLGVTNNGSAGITSGGFPCSTPATGCIYSYNVNGLTLTTGTTAADGLASTGGASGIVVDNNSSLPGTSQIYFTPLTGSTGAVQASQAALQ